VKQIKKSNAHLVGPFHIFTPIIRITCQLSVIHKVFDETANRSGSKVFVLGDFELILLV
jgi:hypothetical protein